MGSITVGFALEVNWNEAAYLDMRVSKEGVQEEGELSTTYFQPLFFKVTPESLLWEVWCAICRKNVFLHHGLELANRGVSVLDVERNVFGTNNLDQISGILTFFDVILDNRDLVVNMVLTLHLVSRFYHFLYFN